MATTFASLGLGDLPLEEKRIIADALMQEVDAECIPGGYATLEEFHAELDRRMDEDDANPDDAIPWEVVYGETTKRLAQMKAVRPTSLIGEK